MTWVFGHIAGRVDVPRWWRGRAWSEGVDGSVARYTMPTGTTIVATGNVQGSPFGRSERDGCCGVGV